jgi:GT2 family glycosyltransferase
LANAAAQFPEDQDVQFAVANALDNDGERLARVNAVLARANLAPLQMVDAARGLSVDNLSAPAPPAPDASRAKVTVIVPVFNGAATVGFALEGLLTQTWGNLEIIAVDDCSTDESAVVLRAFAARDNRINVITQNKNQGTYSARNRALAASTGDFITVHDANDWSHPQKIELQARDLLENERIAGNFSNWARVIDDLVFVGKFRRKDRIVDWNPSSFMFRRALLDKVGGWDEVRISADAELVRRAREAVAGSQEVRAIPTAAPLAFAYDDAASLTKHSATHGRTIFHGVRREYKEASAYWHSVATRDEQRLSPGARPFPAPGPIRSDKENHAECDLLLIADFSAAGLDGALALTDADVAIAEGQRVAVFNWRAYDDNPTTTLPLPLRQRAHEGKLRVIAPGEAVAAERVVIGNPIVLQEMVDIAPKIISFNSLRVMADRADASLDKARVLAHLDEIFGQPGDWG